MTTTTSSQTDQEITEEFENLLKQIDHERTVFDAKTGKALSDLARDIDHAEVTMNAAEKDLRAILKSGTEQIVAFAKKIKI